MRYYQAKRIIHTKYGSVKPGGLITEREAARDKRRRVSIERHSSLVTVPAKDTQFDESGIRYPVSGAIIQSIT